MHDLVFQQKYSYQHTQYIFRDLYVSQYIILLTMLFFQSKNKCKKRLMSEQN